MPADRPLEQNGHIEHHLEAVVEEVLEGPTDTGRVLTVPNVITFVRLSLIPVFLWLLFGREDHAAAAALLAVLGATDWVDGFLARRWHQVSTVGKVLDPVADRLLLGVGVVSIIAVDAVPLWVGLLTVIREVGVGVATVVLAALGARRIDVTWAGKAGTFGQMFAYPLFLASSDPDLAWADVAEVLAWLFVIPGLVFSYYAALMYIPMGRAALREGRVGSAP
jgi:cardiolipin synthase (CMP-forming)